MKMKRKKLLSLESLMPKVIGQEEAISAIANALRRVRAGITDSKNRSGPFCSLARPVSVRLKLQKL